jgi:hypothetical protein
MPEPIKYIVATECDVYPENDYHYIAKQGPDGPVALTEAEMDDAVRSLNGDLTSKEPVCIGHPELRYPCNPSYGRPLRPELSIFIGEGI